MNGKLKEDLLPPDSIVLIDVADSPEQAMVRLGSLSKDWCTGFCRTCGTGCAQYCEEIFKLKAENARLREALELIAAPMRPDGTWNRDRKACQELAKAVINS